MTLLKNTKKIRPIYPKDGEYKIESVGNLSYGEKVKEIIGV